ncbi:hypothetical protein [Campylobacter sp. US50a]|uniref:hypothetical protein n=1 Tax=Campylobacter sp. US50a TaxID=2498122 RepID=UPI001068451D|nr:hypothetical protein [Campylobacter sp. US50a]ECL6143828.1 hypothetical protein [Campylobacter jejuni]ECO2639570.1 hypothetical protein [Campylobacter jejuni]TEX98583.1 hypothetical protein ELQ11_08825 [Campylobacter sp. US50a]HEC1903769.1 hypothetical protein [Campylobacter jejuni]HEC1932201.1 hypothetical protein [Campylobacter jejuni]
MNNEVATAMVLTNLALELNNAIRKVQKLQKEIDTIYDVINEHNLGFDFLEIAKKQNFNSILSYDKTLLLNQTNIKRTL